jgi:hypothetical protein
MGWIRCVGCEKLQRDFMAKTFALIEPVQYVLQQVSCSYETIPNAPKYYKTDRNISLGSNGVDWVHSLRKISTWHCGTNFCINCSSSSCFAPSFMQLRNDPKCTQTLWNTPKHEFSVQWGGSGAFVAKNTMWLVARTFVLIEPVQYVLKLVLCSYRVTERSQMHPNTTKRTETLV